MPIMFESANLKHHVDKAAYKREEAKLREALLDAQFDLKRERPLSGADPDRRRRGRRQGRDGQPAQRVDGPAPHPDQRVRRAVGRGARAARRCGASGARCRPRARSASSSAPGTPCRSSSGSWARSARASSRAQIERDPALREDALRRRRAGPQVLVPPVQGPAEEAPEGAGEGSEDALARHRARLEVLQALRPVRQGVRAVPARDQHRRGAVDRGGGRGPALPQPHGRPAPARGDARAARREAGQAPARQDSAARRRRSTS